MGKGKNKSVLHKQDLKKDDIAVLYVTSCSDINPWMQHHRFFTECIVTGIITESDEVRYIISCAEELRPEPVFGGLFSWEAIVSQNSPFLMSKAEYNRYMSDPKLLEALLLEYEHILSGEKVQPRLRKWQKDALAVINRMSMSVDKVISDIREDFLPDSRKELICFL